MCQRDGRIRNNRLTAALEFVSITRIARSSTEIHSLVAETVATSFSVADGSWTQSIIKTRRFVQSELMLIAHLSFRLLNFSFPRREQRKPGETFGRHGSSL